MPLNDVWKTFSKAIGIYFKATFENVPPAPGAYAWFYPLRVTTHDLQAFLDEVRLVHLYDARTKGKPQYEAAGRLGWSEVNVSVLLENPSSPAGKVATKTWAALVSDAERFDSLRRTLLRSSLLMPPLYVGKTNDLRNRCGQHLDGRTGFADRFESFATNAGLQARRVRDLLFVTILTEKVADGAGETEALVEEILKLVARPPYGVI